MSSILIPSHMQRQSNNSLILQLKRLTSTNFLKKKSYTVGISGVSACNYNFTSVANVTEQSIQMGVTIIPANSSVQKIIVKCTSALVGGTITTDIGVSSGSDEFISGASMETLNAIASCGDVLTSSSSVSSVYFSMTPSANWSLLTAGKWTIDIYYIDNTP